MSAKGGAEDDARLAIYQDGSSRLLALVGLPHLSTRQSRSFSDTLSGSNKRRRIILDPQAPLLSLQQQSATYNDGGLGDLPIWNQMHNKRCSICENALFLGINCSSEENGRVRCMTCKSYFEREEEPSHRVKRLFRSVRTRQSMKGKQLSIDQPLRSVVKKKANGDRREEQHIKGLEDEERHRRIETPTKKPEKVKTLLQQRADDLKRKSKGEKKKKRSSDVKDTIKDEVGELGDVPLYAAAKDDVKKEEAASLKRKEHHSSSSKQDDTLRQMLAQKRAKKEQEKASSKADGGKGGLLDFLSSID
jgi:hypothetical protein